MPAAAAGAACVELSGREQETRCCQNGCVSFVRRVTGKRGHAARVAVLYHVHVAAAALAVNFGRLGTPVRVDVSSTSLLPDLRVGDRDRLRMRGLTNNGMARMIDGMAISRAIPSIS